MITQEDLTNIKRRFIVLDLYKFFKEKYNELCKKRIKFKVNFQDIIDTIRGKKKRQREMEERIKEEFESFKASIKPEYSPSIEKGFFVNYDRKPVSTYQYNALSDNFNDNKNLTIVMQGPIKQENNFTIETIRLYKKTFKNCPIILSTWDTEDEQILKQLEHDGVIVLRNSAPEVKGLWNVNYQIKSTKEGLKKAKELGAEYVIKTRTDQRFYETNIAAYLFNLLKIFPKNSDVQNQKERLISLSMNTFKYRLYDISDMFLFGHIDDVINYWDMPYETRTEFPKWNSLLEYCKLLPSEIGFGVSYVEKMGHKCDYTLKDSWECYAKYFCIIDASSLRLYWPKYTNDAFRWRNFTGEQKLLEELTFKEWLSLYSNNQKDIPEDILNETYV